MKSRPYVLPTLIFGFILLFCASAYGGQVITESVRQWAEQAVAQEAALTTQLTPNSIAILYYNNSTGTAKFDALQKGLAIMLITDFSKLDRFQVVERIKIQALIDEENLNVSGLSEQKHSERLGILLGAAYVSGGDIGAGTTTDLAVSPQMVNVPQTAISNQPMVSGNLNDLNKVEKAILWDMIEFMDIELTEEEREKLEKPIAADIDVLMEFFNGVHASDMGNYALAAKHYQQSIALAPGFVLAVEALAELEKEKLWVQTGQTSPKSNIVPGMIGVATGAGIIWIIEEAQRDSASPYRP